MSLIDEFCADLGLPEGEAGRVRVLDGPGLPGRLAAGDLANGAVGCLGLAATLGTGATVTVDPARVTASFRADQLQLTNGVAVDGFAPGSGFFRTADGWLRTHANYPRHRAALLAVLSLPPSASRDDIAAAVAGRGAYELESAVYAAGGIAVAVRTEAEWRSHPQSAAVATLPLVSWDQYGGGTRDRRRLRVLDLTRVIAGPVATRALAWLGHDVLRIDPPWLPEIEAQHLDTGPGKRTALLDVRQDRGVFEGLVARADVVVVGYRPDGAGPAGLGAAELLERNPRLIVASLSAWGGVGPWGGRRGFDSIVQAATGIGVIEGTPERPGALAAQALDHATGYLLAAAVLRAAGAGGGGHEIRLSLARTARWLLGAARADATVVPDVTAFLVERDTYAGVVRGPLPALELPGVAPADYPFPARPFGRDTPEFD